MFSCGDGLMGSLVVLDDRLCSGIRGVRGAGRGCGGRRRRAGVRAGGAAGQRGEGVQVAEPSP